MKSETILQLNNINVFYDGLKALDDMSLSIATGEIVALMGPNGAGKSTVLKTIFGLTTIQSGDLLWHNNPIKPIPHQMVKLGIAFVPQGRRVFAHLTVEENLEIGGFTLADSKLVKSRLAQVVDIFPILKKKLKDKSGSLSGGQQQMLALARGLMTDPKVLLLDEPTLGLAPKIVSEVFEKIQEINEVRHTSIVVVEHNIKSLLTIVNRAYVLDHGRVITCDSAAAIINSDILERVFMGRV